MELWERTPALEVLDGLLRASAAGGRVAVVAEEAGLGKSSLVGEFARRCGPRARVLWGGCDRLVTPRALGPLQDIGRQTGGALAAALAGNAAQGEVFAAFLDELDGRRAAGQRVRPVVVVEDVHWADGATLDWLRFIGRRIERLPALLVLTYRDDELGLDHPLRGALAALPAAIVHRVAVAPLSAACVAEQAVWAGRDPDMVRRLAGGNPLLVTELLKADGDAVPGAVQDLILDRLRDLPPGARDLAHLVSVVPTRADGVLVAGAADDVDLAIAAGVLVPAGDGVSFRHELLRSAVEDALSPTRRAALHRRVLAVLDGVAGVDPGRLVHHAVLAGDAAAVLRHGPVAGADAARRGSHREAAAHYRSATRHAGQLPRADRAALLERFAEQAYLVGAHDEGLQARLDALALRDGQVERMAENLGWVSRVAWWTGDAVRAQDAVERAVAVLAGRPEDEHLARAYCNLSHLYALTYDLDDAVVWGERARVLAERLGDLDTAVYAAINVGSARMAVGSPGAQEALEAAHETAAAHGMTLHAGRALSNIAGALSDELARYTDAGPAVERALTYSVAHDIAVCELFVLAARARTRLETGDWSGALADADAVLARSGPTGVTAVLPLVVRGRILSARGHPAALPTLDHAAREADRIRDVQVIAPVADARAEYFHWAGDPDRARAEARRGLDAAATRKAQPFVTGRLVYRYHRAGGEGPLPPVVAAPFQSMITGDWRSAAVQWQARGARYLRAEALSEGDGPAAVEALRLYDDLGAIRAAEHVRARLRRDGVPNVPRGPRRATAAHAAGLTPRQSDVLHLLVEGLTTAEIAARLTLSAKTVEHHVSAVLAKLGVTNRAQAVSAAHRLDLTRRS